MSVVIFVSLMSASLVLVVVAAADPASENAKRIAYSGIFLFILGLMVGSYMIGRSYQALDHKSVHTQSDRLVPLEYGTK